MVLQEKNQYSYDEYALSKEDKIKKLSKDYNLTQKRLKTLINRLEQNIFADFHLSVFEAINEAAYAMGGKEALEFFESQKEKDLIQYLHKWSYVHFFNDRFSPFLTLKELAILIKEFIEHLELNKDHLIETGHPKYSFNRSIWLDWHFTRLYYTKVPVLDPIYGHYTDPENIDALQQKLPPTEFSTTVKKINGKYEFNYVWSKAPAIKLGILPYTGTYVFPGRWVKPSLNFKWKDGTPYYETGNPIEICSYKDAAILHKLDPEDAKWLEKMRSRLFQLRIEILEYLQRSIINRDHKNLLPQCLQILTEHDNVRLTGDEMESLLKLEASFAENHSVREFCTQLRRITITDDSAFIFNIIGLIGYIEKEVNIGTIDKTCERYQDLPEYGSYFDSIGKQWQKKLDGIINQYIRMSREEISFWENYSDRINNAWRTEFYDETPPYGELVKRKHAKLFENKMKSWAVYEAHHFRVTGFPSSLPLGKLERDDAPIKINDFSHASDYSWVKMKGKVYHLTKTQACFIRLLHEDYLKGGHGQSVDYLFDNCSGIQYARRNIRDIFRSLKGWKELIISVEGRKGIYRLNL